MLTVVNQTRNTSLGAQVQTASSFAHRLLGLTPLKKLPQGHGLFIPSCRSVHTIGMRMPLDIILLDRNHRVIATLARIKPNRLLFPRRKVWAVLELAPGAIEESGTEAGDLLEISTHPDQKELI